MMRPFTLSLLPYDENALSPVISGKTVGFHYHKHHSTYVDTLNTLVKGTKYADMTLEEIARATLKATGETEKKIFNNAGQVWNHDFYWRSLTPKGGKPKGALKDAIDRDFGNLETLIEELAKTGKEQFGSGWAWLISKDGKLSVDKTANAVDPMAMGINCLLTVDVWEHAYYLDYQNERPKYLEAVLSKLLNWDFAGENLAKDSSRPNSTKITNAGEKAKAGADKVYRHPQEIANATALSLPQKIELLKQWEVDLRELMVASEENMPSSAAPGETGELLRNVRLLLTRLGAPEHEPAAVNKAGG
jgi:Fe-Mn family superoxide dismutase